MRITNPERGNMDAFEEMQDGFAMGGQILRLLCELRPKFAGR
jgi:hypothetical protein